MANRLLTILCLAASILSLSARTCKIGVIADYSFAQFHANEQGGVRKYATDAVNEVSGYLAAQFGISLQMQSLYIAETKDDPLAFTGITNGDSYSEMLKETIPPSDLCFVVVFTSIDFGKRGGESPLGKACQGRPFFVSDKSRNPRHAFLRTFMHELGHMLGGNHDNDGPCDGQGFALQTGRNPFEVTENDFKYSPCSKRDIYPNLASFSCIA